MKNQNKLVLKIYKKEGTDADFGTLQNEIALKRIKELENFEVVIVYDIISSFHDEIEEYLSENNTPFTMPELITESIIKKDDKVEIIISKLIVEMEKFDIEEDLIIIDPYFLTKSKDAQAQNDNEKIFTKVCEHLSNKNINNLIIITDSGKINNDTKTSYNRIANEKNVYIEVKNTSDFHDRFWICKSTKQGMFVGTSLNGLGKKYSVISKLEETDCKDILSALVDEELV